MGRKLTHDELMAARSQFLGQERAKHPEAIIDLLVAPHLTNEGEVSYTLYLTTVRTVVAPSPALEVAVPLGRVTFQ